MGSEKRATGGSVQALERMWRNSNTEERILQEVRDKYGVQMYMIFKQGEFLTIGDLWIILLTEEEMDKYLRLPGARFYFELDCGVRLKPWVGKVDNLLRLLEAVR